MVCLLELFGVVRYMCVSRKEMCSGAISLSRFTVARRIDDLWGNIELSLKLKITKCSACSIALDKSTDVSDTAQLVFQLSH